jgi:hypothetical protein
VYSFDGVANVLESHMFTPINLQHPNEDGIDFGRERKDGRKEVERVS